MVATTSERLAAGLETILVRPEHPGNVGASCRALANFGLPRLALVSTEVDLDAARPLAHGAEDILDGARRLSSLDEALVGTQWVVASTARRSRRESLPLLSPMVAAGQVLDRIERGENVALVFGPERTGLAGDDLRHADALVSIPAGARQPSLNLSQAVLLLSWELHRAHLGRQQRPERPTRHTADAAQRAELVALAMKTLVRADGQQNRRPESIERLLSQLLGRALPGPQELHRLMGVLRRVEAKLPPSDESPG